MKSQEIINEIEREEREIRNHRQEKPNCLNIEVMKQMTIGQIKKAEEFFNIQKKQEQTDLNLSLCFKKLR